MVNREINLPLTRNSAHGGMRGAPATGAPMPALVQETSAPCRSMPPCSAPARRWTSATWNARCCARAPPRWPSKRTAAADCGRTPLIGETLYRFAAAESVCELCRPLRGGEPESSARVRSSEYGHAVRIHRLSPA